jgi:hypothetical protein
MKTFKQYFQERMDDDELADIKRREERQKRDAEKKKEKLKARKARYQDSP